MKYVNRIWENQASKRMLYPLCLTGLVLTLFFRPAIISYASEGIAESQDADKIQILWDSSGGSVAVGILIEPETESNEALFVYSNYDPSCNTEDIVIDLYNGEYQEDVNLNYIGVYANSYLGEQIALWTEGEKDINSGCYFQRGTATAGEKLKAEFLTIVNQEETQVFAFETTVSEIQTSISDDECAYISLEPWNEENLTICYPGALVNENGQCVGLIYANGLAFCSWYQEEENGSKLSSDMAADLITEEISEPTTLETSTVLETQEITTENDERFGWVKEMPVIPLMAGAGFLLLLFILIAVLFRLLKQDRQGPYPHTEEETDETKTLMQDDETRNLGQDDETKTML